MKLRAILSMIGVAGCLTAGFAFGVEPVKQARPNVIIFLVDDIGYSLEPRSPLQGQRVRCGLPVMGIVQETME